MKHLLQIEIDSLVSKYKKGDMSAEKDLLKLFFPLLQKYYNLVNTGVIDPTDNIMCTYLGTLSNDIHQSAEIIKNALGSTDGVMEELQEILRSSLLSADISSQFRSEAMGYLLNSVDNENGAPEVLDEAWVEGRNASHGFEDLNDLERFILVSYYQNKLTDEELAFQLSNSEMEISTEDVRNFRTSSVNHIQEVLKGRGYLK